MNLVIDKIVIRKNSDGLFSLNDLHRATGGFKKDEPARFLRNEKAKSLIEEILITQKWVIKKSAGRYGSSWVCKELVYAYAMWISPKFMLRVIQTFDALANNELEKAVSIAKTVTKLEMINAHKELIFHDESKSVIDKLNGITANECAYKATASDAGKALGKCRGQKADYADKKQKLQNELQLTLSI